MLLLTSCHATLTYRERASACGNSKAGAHPLAETRFCVRPAVGGCADRHLDGSSVPGSLSAAGVDPTPRLSGPPSVADGRYVSLHGSTTNDPALLRTAARHRAISLRSRCYHCQRTAQVSCCACNEHRYCRWPS